MVEPNLGLLQKEVIQLRELLDMPLAHGGGGNHTGGMEQRVTRLEVEFEHVRKDLNEIKSDLKSVLGHVTELPTKADLWQWKIQWTALSVAAIALIVGGVIGGLSWIKPDTPSPQPIVIQVPQTAPSSTP